MARLTPALECFARAAAVIVLDGAMWGRPLFSHLRADQALPVVCGWQVEHIVLTQIGRTAPPHGQLERRVRALCLRARPGWDGLELRLPERARGGGAAERE